MYPTLGALWYIGPEHLGNEFPEELDGMRLERIDLKHRGLGKSSDANLLKLAMNGGYYGNLNNEYTPMFDQKALLKVTINGQLSLLMLCEKLINIGAEILMCNTDGVTYKCKRTILPQVQEVKDWWQRITKTELETVEYKKIVVSNINNYMAFYVDKDSIKIKEKGAYLTNPPIDQSRDFLVIPKAIQAYFKTGQPVEEFITNHNNIYDFCACQKVDSKYTVYWNGQKQQKLNRYYVSRKGAFLYKSKNGNDMSHMLKGWGVQLFNDYVEKEDYQIDYTYYISEAKKLLNELEPAQLTLF